MSDRATFAPGIDTMSDLHGMLGSKTREKPATAIQAGAAALFPGRGASTREHK